MLTLLWRFKPEVVMLFIRAWHRLRIKAQLFSGSVSSERTSCTAPCVYAPKVRTDSNSDLAAVFNLNTKGDFCFICWDWKHFGGICAFVWICGLLLFTHLKLALGLRFLLVCRTAECVCREQGVDKRLLNAGDRCSGEVQTPHSGWERGVFVAKLWLLEWCDNFCNEEDVF